MKKIVSEINRKNGINLTIFNVARTNKIINPNIIKAGENIVVPSTTGRDERIEGIKKGEAFLIDVAVDKNAKGAMRSREGLFPNFPVKIPIISSGWADDDKSLVNKYNEKIDNAAKVNNVDKDLVKSIIHVESSQDASKIILRTEYFSNSLLPGNVGKNWYGLEVPYKGKKIKITKENLKNPEFNIYATANILSSLKSRTINPTNRKVGILYNNTGADMKIRGSNKKNGQDYGALIEKFAKEKPWEKK